MSKQAQHQRSSEDAFEDAVELINDILDEDGDKDTQRKAEEVVRLLPTDRDIGVAVFGADPMQPSAFYEVSFNGSELEATNVDQDQTDVSCRLSRQNLENVCDAPQDYMTRPLEIELLWLMSRHAA